MWDRASHLGRCLMSGVAHAGEIYQRNLLVGIVLIVTLVGYGAAVTAIFVFVGRAPSVILISALILAVFIDGSYIEMRRRKAVILATATFGRLEFRELEMLAVRPPEGSEHASMQVGIVLG